MEVTDLEDSTRVKEAGIEGIHSLVWALNAYGEWYITTTGNTGNKEEYYPAYSLEELLEMVEGELDLRYRHNEVYLLLHGNKPWTSAYCLDPKKAVVEALLWQKEEK